jgi:hypothetical protein
MSAEPLANARFEVIDGEARELMANRMTQWS